MLRKLYVALVIAMTCASSALAQSGGAIKAKVIDKSTRETIPFAVVTALLSGVQVTGGVTNINGEVVLKPLDAGKYTIRVQYTGYQTTEVRDIIVSELKTTPITIEMNATATQLKDVEIVEYREPLIDPDTKSGGTVTREEFLAMPSKNINSVASTTAGIFQRDEGSNLQMRGQRSGGTAYFIDGQRVIGSTSLPQQSIEQVSVITGGVPAQFGDAGGGVVNITTRGPQSQYFGGVELITSEVLDAYGYNFVGFSAGGPLWMRKDSAGNKTTPLLGFIISGEGVSERDDDPSAIGIYKVKDDVLRELEENPLRPSPLGAGFLRSSEFIRVDDLEKIKARQNVAARALRLNVKLDFKPTENLNITFGGSIDLTRRHEFIYEYALFNPANNPLRTENTWRVYARLTQRFGSSSAESASNIKNAFYTLQVGYTNYTFVREDDTHKDNYFNYGYIGKFTQYRSRFFLPQLNYVTPNGDTIDAYVQQAFADSALTFDGSNSPNALSAYYADYVFNNSITPITTYLDVPAQQGLINGYRAPSVYSLWWNTGRQFPSYQKQDFSQFRVFTSFSADIKDHAIQVGFEFEQRVEREFNLNAYDLWQRMRQLANVHLSQLDLDNPTIVDYGTYDAVLFESRYDSTQRFFDRSLREKLGYAYNSTNWLDIDNYDPSLYSLDMFSADDLLGEGAALVNYYGFDHTGKKLKGTFGINDFLSKNDNNNNPTRTVDAFRPIYMAGYIQDKFDFKDLKFNIGLRIDRFDANQSVLKDPYVFTEAKTVAEVSNLGDHPSNMGSDYVVYVNSKRNPTAITGYRSGNRWFDRDGNEIADVSLITQQSNGQAIPYLVDPDEDRITAKSFKDYDPQINVMPRIAFTFPISDEANFFAHYDVLTQRPTDGSRLSLIEYLFINSNVGAFVNNPSLKPQRTTDYELGFTQTLNERKNSAITLSAFYREFRNMIQLIAVNFAYPANYLTYGNVDFGTVKGFTVAYDLRRTGGVQLTASYTLQFADGTGSGATEAENLLNAGQPNLRTTLPLSFDQRHAIVTNIDYRFGSGSNYRGPVVGKKEMRLFDNMGANLVLRAGSGTPYSRQSNATPEAQFSVQARPLLDGLINGSRLPWQIRADLRIDKNIDLSWGGSADGTGKKVANLNIYLQVLNLLNTKNVLNIYRYTGNANDDGYLTDASAQALIAAQNDPQAFRDLYSAKLSDPSYYSIPRRIRLGVMLDF
jgi:hypothetical protein